MLSLSLSFSLVHSTAYRYIHPYIYNLHFERAQTELFTIFVLSVNLYFKPSLGFRLEFSVPMDLVYL